MGVHDFFDFSSISSFGFLGRFGRSTRSGRFGGFVRGACLGLVVLGLACGCAVFTPAVPKLPMNTPTVSVPKKPVNPWPWPDRAGYEPAAMKENNEKGAIEAVKYYFDTIAYAYNTGDITTLKTMSDPNCKICKNFIKHAQELNKPGGWSYGEPLKYVFSKCIDNQPDKKIYVVLLEIEEKGRTTKISKGNYRITEAIRGTLEIQIKRVDDSWKILGNSNEL